MFRMILAAALLLALPATHALAEPARGLLETRTQRGFIGIEIPLSGEMQPRVSVGLRRATVTEDGSLRGGELRLVLNPSNLRDAQLRALALKGRVTGALALGGGWDFAGGTAFASVGMVMPRLSGTLDIGGGAVPAMSIGFDTLGRFDIPVAPPPPVAPPVPPAPPVVLDPCGAPLHALQPAPRC